MRLGDEGQQLRCDSLRHLGVRIVPRPVNIQAVGMKLVRAKGNRGTQGGDVSFVAMGLGSKNQSDLPSRSSA
jgi:hypothetical protein